MLRKLLLIILLLGSALSALAEAFYVDFNGYEISYHITSSSDLTVLLYSVDEEYSGSIYIPSSVTYEGKTYSVTYIWDGAFQNCKYLTSVTIPNSVTGIGSYAFYGCTGLTSVTIPNSVTAIWNYAFSGCTGLRVVTIPNSITSIKNGTFYGCTGLTSVTIPNSVTSIGQEAFSRCTGLMEVTLPNSVTSIGNFAFSGCTGLTEVTLPNSVTSIGNYAFYGCSSINKLTLGTSIAEIGTEAFYDCSKLEVIFNASSLNLTKGSTDYGYVAYYASDIYNITEQDDFLFDYKKKVLLRYRGEASSITLPLDCNGSPYTIYEDAFAGKNIHSVTIPNNVTGIGARSFQGCRNLTSIHIGSGVLSMGSEAFKDCPNLYKVFLLGNTKPDGIENAFTALSGRVTYTSNNKYDQISALGTIKKYSLLNSKFEVDGVIYIPTSMSARTCDAIDCTYSPEISNIDIEPTVLYRGVVFNVSGANNHTLRNNPFITSAKINMPGQLPSYMLASCSGIESLTVGEQITALGDKPFMGMDSLASLTLADCNNSLPVTDNSILRDTQLGELYLGRDISYTAGSTLLTYSPFSGLSTLRSLKIGKNVTTLGPSMFRSSALEGIISFPNGFTTIGDYAFAENPDISRLVLSSTVSQIGRYAFSGTNPESLRFPASVQNIGEGAFDGCANITSIRFDDSAEPIDIKCNFSNSGTKTLYIGRNFSGLQTPCAGNTTIENASLSECVTVINASMFDGCSSLKVVNIPSTVASVPNYAFRNCAALESIEFPSAVRTIGVGAFKGSGLKNVAVERTVTSIGTEAFANCSGLQYATLRAANIGESAFAGAGLIQLDISTDVSNIYSSAFRDCIKLQSAEIGASSIGTHAFNGCAALVSVHLADKTLSIGASAFKDCSKLSSINIPEGNTQIASSAFAGTSSLAELVLPQSVLTLGDGAFNGSGLNSIVIPSKVTTISNKAFANTSKLILFTFDAAEQAITVANDAFEAMKVETMYLNRQLNYNTSNNSPLYGNATLRTVVMNDRPTSLLTGMFKNCSALQSVQISENVSEIGAQSFRGCTSLTTVNIPSKVNEIKDYTFQGCSSLRSIDLPGVTKLGQYSFANAGLMSFVVRPGLQQIALGSFQGCNALEEFVALSGSKTLELSNSASNKGLFADCPLKKVSIDRPISYSILPAYGYSPFYRVTTLTTVELGDYVPSVPDNMFYGCSGLTDVVIGDGVTSFGKYAFSGCRSIQRFYFGGNVQSIGEEAFSDCAAMVEMWSKAVEPPTCGSQALDDIDKWNCELFVPLGTIGSYAAAEQWQDFLFTGESTGKSIMATGISLSKLSLNLKIDETANIMATILPTSVQDNFPVTWTSSNEDVAVVVDGRVTAVGDGECQIIATTQGNGVIMSACNVTVDKLDQELMWVQAFGAAYIGDNISFTGKADSGLDISYRITGGDNVGVLSGNVLSINDIGTIEITAVQPGNNRYNSSNSVVRTLTVIPINPKNIDVVSDVTVHVGQSLALNAKIEPVNVYDKSVTWKSLDESIVTVDASGVITGVYNGDTYIVATASNGLMANCHVTVNSLGNDYLSIDDAEIQCNSQWDLPVKLTNISDIASAEFDIELPDAVTFDTSTDGYLEPTLSSRASGYSVIATMLDDRTAHVEIFSLGSDTFSGESGDTILTIPVKAASSRNTAIIKLTNVKLYTSDFATILPGADNATINILSGGMMGDVNENEVINITDAVMILSDAIGKPLQGYNADLADVDGNGSITVTDAVWVVRYTLGIINQFPCESASQKQKPMRSMSEITLAAVADSNDEYEVNINLEGVDLFAAMQMSIEIPDGYEYVPESLTLTDRTERYHLAVNDDCTSLLRVATFSTSLSPIDGTDGAVLSLRLHRIDANPSATIVVTDIEMTDTEGRAYHLSEASCKVDDINALDRFGYCDHSIIYGYGLTLHVIVPEAQTIYVTDLSGKSIPYNVQAGHNTIVVDVPGFYIVSTNDKTAKILMK